ncbi:MAG: ankyrin repeat domain-containing protein [Legionella sp.]|nr:ankyrin repeat domain-containing protein [Legionella sp.]
MGKVILIHANCQNSTAKGDFAFAGDLAKDIVNELANQKINDIDVFLVSTLDGVARFISLYGAPVEDRVSVEGTSIGLSSLETFNAVDNKVVAFIDANRCKHASTDIVKRVLSPDSKFLFVGNLNKQAYADLFIQSLYRMQVKNDQPKLYDSFDDDDILIASAGFGSERLGLPSITKAGELPSLSSSDLAQIPTDNYGFMYLAQDNPYKDYKLIAQYMKLSVQDKYILVGNFMNKQYEIQDAYNHDTTLFPSKSLPNIEYHQSLPKGVMRQTVAQANSTLVLSTGVISTLEAIRDKKLPFYQYIDINNNFVASYLIAVKSAVSNDNSLFGAMPQMIIELSELLFADKPLSRMDIERADTLLKLDSISSRLINTNQEIIDKASGKIAPRLLSFLGEPRKTNDQVQLAHVCVSLRKSGELGSPTHAQALRRAATWGRLFELKVLIKSMSQNDLDKADPTFGRSALQWATVNKNFDCARALIKVGASLDLQDKNGQTALHKAVQLGDLQIIKILIEAGASVDITDDSQYTPKDFASDNGIILFINNCHSAMQIVP